MIRRFLLALVLAFPSLLTQSALAAGPLGLGLVLAGPTGLTGNYQFERDRSIAVALGWDDNDFQLHVDHLWYQRGLIKIDGISIDVQLGLGLRWLQVDTRYEDDDTEIGVRAPIGVSYTLRKVPLQLFGELGPALILVDSSSFVVDIALGGRYYF
jgi:hypothetical protein